MTSVQLEGGHNKITTQRILAMREVVVQHEEHMCIISSECQTVARAKRLGNLLVPT